MGGHNRNRSVGHENHGIAFGHANWDAVIKEKILIILKMPGF